MQDGSGILYRLHVGFDDGSSGGIDPRPLSQEQYSGSRFSQELCEVHLGRGLDKDGEKCKECVEEYVYSQGPKTDSDGPEGFEGVDASAPTDSAKAVPTIDKKISPYVSSIIRLTKTPGSPYESRVMYSISFPKMTE